MAENFLKIFWSFWMAKLFLVASLVRDFHQFEKWSEIMKNENYKRLTKRKIILAQFLVLFCEILKTKRKTNWVFLDEFWHWKCFQKIWFFKTAIPGQITAKGETRVNYSWFLRKVLPKKHGKIVRFQAKLNLAERGKVVKMRFLNNSVQKTSRILYLFCGAKSFWN